jgi:hypothetical protein
MTVNDIRLDFGDQPANALEHAAETPGSAQWQIDRKLMNVGTGTPPVVDEYPFQPRQHHMHVKPALDQFGDLIYRPIGTINCFDYLQNTHETVQPENCNRIPDDRGDRVRFSAAPDAGN